MRRRDNIMEKKKEMRYLGMRVPIKVYYALQNQARKAMRSRSAEAVRILADALKVSLEQQ